MNKIFQKVFGPSSNGISLLELMIALAISSLLSLTMIHMASATRSSFRLQESLAELQENGRYFADLTAYQLSDSAYHPQPWLHDSTPIGLMADSADTGSNSDKLVSRSWSERNCFGTPNPAMDGAGQRRFYLKESTFELNSSSLALTCRYGPDATDLTTQINRQGAIADVEVFQALYAVDLDGDELVDDWIRAGEWRDPSQVHAVRLGILSRSRESHGSLSPTSFRILDFDYTAPADGRLRREISYTLPLHRLRP
jgi:type IV pilus assembly protein PilW